MKNLLKKLVLMALLIGLPFTALAMSHGDDKEMKHGDMKHGDMKHDDMKHDDMKHGSMDHGEHGSMGMEGDMIMLGNAVEDGVKAMAHLKDVGKAMAKMGMATTHHVMFMFVDQASGDPIESGVAAVKIERPDGTESGPIKLMGMQGHFGADIELPEAGKYEFKVGTKLADGKKRQFEFEYTLK